MQTHAETVLVVDDEWMVRRAAARLLQRYGYVVLQAGSGAEAIQIWRGHRDRIELVLMDIVLPDGVTGRDLAAQFLMDKPGVRIVYTSGYSADLLPDKMNLTEGVNFIQKPYAPGQLADLLKRDQSQVECDAVVTGSSSKQMLTER